MEGTREHGNPSRPRHIASPPSRTRQKDDARLAVQPRILNDSRKPPAGKIGERGRDHHGVEALVRDPLDRGFVTVGRHELAARRSRRLFENLQQAGFVVNQENSKTGPAHLPPQGCSIMSHDNWNFIPVKPPPWWRTRIRWEGPLACPKIVSTG